MSNGLKDLLALAENAKKLDGQHSIPVTELLSSSFVAACWGSYHIAAKSDICAIK